MKRFLLILCALIGIYHAASAQRILDKIDRISTKVDRANDKVDRAANTADRTSGTVSRLAGMFKGNSAGSTSKTINIKNASLAQVQAVRRGLSNIPGAQVANMKYNRESSAILVTYAGSTDELLENLQKQAGAIVNGNTVSAVQKRSITVSL